MSSHLVKTIMFTDVVSIHPSSTVEEGLTKLKEHGLRSIPVIDDSGSFLGMFSCGEVLEHLVPLVGFFGESLDFAVGMAPDLAKRLKEFYPLKIEQFTEKNVYHVKPGTHTWESLRALAKHGSPLPVVDHENGNKFIGLVSEQSALETLISMCEK